MIELFGFQVKWFLVVGYQLSVVSECCYGKVVFAVEDQNCKKLSLSVLWMGYDVADIKACVRSSSTIPKTPS